MAAIAAGLGGGLLMGNIVSPQSAPQEMTRLEQRMASQRSQAAPSVEPAQPAPPMATITAANTPPSPSPAPPQGEVQAASLPKSEPANVSAPPAPAQTAAVTPPSPTASTPETAQSQPEVKKQTARAPEDSNARARDVDVRRVERRRERRQQWAEKRRLRPQDELREVEEAVRDDTERGPFTVEPVRNEMPRIKLFGLE